MSLFDAGRRGDGVERVSDRVMTVPNAISGLRLAAMPVFVWLVLERRSLGIALLLLAVVAATDWVDGYVARRFDQVSRIGKVIDPLIDRIMLASVVVTLGAAGLLPWVVVIAVLARDVLVVGASFALYGAVPPIPVSNLGKSATAVLFVGLPLFLFAEWSGLEGARAAAWALSLGGLAAYYGAGVQYGRTALAMRRRRGAGDHGAASSEDAGERGAG